MRVNTKISRSLIASCVVCCVSILAPAVFAQIKWNAQAAHVVAKASDTEVTAKYSYVNAGKTEIALQAEAACGCLMVSLSKENLLPGDRGELTAVYAIGDRAGDTRQIILVNSKNPQVEDILTLDIVIPPMVVFSPPKLIWNRGEMPSAKDAIVSLAKDAPFTLTRATSSDPSITATLVKGEKTDSYSLRVRPAKTDHAIRAIVQIMGEPISSPHAIPGPAKQRTFSVYVWVR